jgi:hypothetical protein
VLKRCSLVYGEKCLGFGVVWIREDLLYGYVKVGWGNMGRKVGLGFGMLFKAGCLGLLINLMSAAINCYDLCFFIYVFLS